MNAEYCTLDEALLAAAKDGLVMQPPAGGWLFMDAANELETQRSSTVRVTRFGVRREIQLPNGDRLAFVPATAA